ncbi:MAG: hypothetical protein AB2598_10725 [Candidatus Thiodiazotropha sp.]
MPEGSFIVLAPKTQEHNVDKIMSFLKDNGAYRLNSKSIGREYIEISSDSALEFSSNKFVEFCQSILDDDGWFRIYENDEYGTEGFWYIDLNSKWRICSDQDEPNASTLRAYRKWHVGLDGITYGVVDEKELQLLEEKYGLFDSSGNTISDPFPPLKTQVGVNPSFIGKNILVPHAGKYWDWYIPDHECLAAKISANVNCGPDDLKIEYRRSYIIEGDVGFVWSWMSNGTEILLFFMFYGESSCCQRVLKNYENVSIDEAILIAYYDTEFEEGFDQPEEWVTSPGTDDFLHQPIQNINDSPFDVGDWVNVFDGRIMSPYSAALVQKDERYYLARYIGDDDVGSYIEILDPEMDEKLNEYVPSLYSSIGQGLYIKPKLRMKSRTEISEIIGAKFIEYDDEDNEIVIGEWPLSLDASSRV